MKADSDAPVALVLTDIVGSTELAATLGAEGNAEVWSKHDDVARSLVRELRGTEVERTDGIMVLFDDVQDALRFADAYQRALEGLEPPLEARVAVHRGSVAVRRNPADHVARGAKPVEADGLSLSLTARLNSIARGGQILVTRDALPPDREVESHGHWRFKGAPDPVEVFEVPRAHRNAEPPLDNDKATRVVQSGAHWIPVREIPHALPAEFDRFVGRREALRTLEQRLSLPEQRLVTVVGAGGSGKTRLVTHYGWAHLGDYEGGVWFCDLCDAKDRRGIVRAVAMALGVSLGGSNPVAQLRDAIADRGRCLLVLDNFEQVSAHAADTVEAWVRGTSVASFLVTSRERLDLPGEAILELPPLAASESLALFETRAAVQIDPPSPEEGEALARLLDLLDHLPLTIELAAARARVLTPSAMVERMTERFELLKTPGGGADRQATLRATLDWSWDLLTADEQSALAQLSLFEGGFTLDAALAVLALDETWPVDAVQSLVDKSLVRRVAGNRLDMLVSVQAYATERRLARDDHEAAAQRHGAYYAALPEVGSDLENVVAACRRAARRADAAVALPTLRAAWAVLDQQGPPDLAAQLAREVDGLPGLAPGLTARMHAEARLALGAHQEGQQELRDCVRQLGFPEPRTMVPGLLARILWASATQVARRLGGRRPRPRGTAEVVMTATRAYQRLVETYWFVNASPRMLGAALTALDLCEPLGPSPELARAYGTLALATGGLRLDRASDHYAALALQTAQGSGSPLAEGYVRFLACVSRIGHGRWSEVDRDLELARRLFEGAQDRRLLGDTVTVQGMAALYRGNFDAAEVAFAQVRRAGRAHGNAQHQVWAALGAAEARLRLGHVEGADEAMGEAMAVLDGFPSPTEAARAWGLRAAVQLALGRRESARASADQAARRLRALGSPTAHYLLEGYASTAEVLLALGGPSRRPVRALAAFARTFPIGQPRLDWLRASTALERGDERRAARFAVSGLEAASRLGMAHEQSRLAALWPDA